MREAIQAYAALDLDLGRIIREAARQLQAIQVPGTEEEARGPFFGSLGERLLAAAGTDDPVEHLERRW